MYNVIIGAYKDFPFLGIYILVFSLLISYILDLIMGDPEHSFHPIRIIGNNISFLEKIVRRALPDSPKFEIFGGSVLVLTNIVMASSVPILILFFCLNLNPFLTLVVDGALGYYLLSIKSLKAASLKIYETLEKGDIDEARRLLSFIVGRDTQNLNEEGIIKATVETVAENTADGAVAPMLYMAIGFSPLAYLYKAINTMDSMIAYKNEKYLYFGRFAAKIDDIANYIPARLSALFMIMASFFLGFNYKNAIKIFLRDRYKHASPNSAQTEAVCAGALEIKLAGDNYYFGKLYKKEYIGDAIRSISKEDIKKANSLLYVTSFISIVFCILIRILILWLI